MHGSPTAFYAAAYRSILLPLQFSAEHFQTRTLVCASNEEMCMKNPS